MSGMPSDSEANAAGSSVATLRAEDLGPATERPSPLLSRASLHGASPQPYRVQPAVSKHSFRADIEGLRAVAVVLVVLYHAGAPGFGGGYVGVDVFFVISGFLITSHLVGAAERARLRDFYARRILRILPASMLVLGVTLLASLWVLPVLQIRAIVEDAIATALYVPNVLFARRGTDYLADLTPSPFQHYWSLGVEEQFYLVWPLLLWITSRAVQGRRTWIFGVVALLVATSFALCVFATPRAQPYAFFLLPTRAWELGLGGIIGLAVTYGWIGVDGASEPSCVRARAQMGLAAITGWLGLAMILSAGTRFDAQTLFPGAVAAIPVLGTALILACGSVSTAGGPVVLLRLAPLQWIGRLSYSIYLWHWPLLVLTAAAAAHELTLEQRLLLAACTLPLAAFSYHAVEQPFRHARQLRLRPLRTIGCALGGSTAVVVVALATGAAWERRPLHAGIDAATEPLGIPPRFTAVVPRNLMPSLRDVERDLPRVYHDGCHLDWQEAEPTPCLLGAPHGVRTLVLFGDSHAAQWVPALERYASERGLRLVTHTKRGCPSVDMPKLHRGSPFLACDAWRRRVLEQLRRAPPQLVVITNAHSHRPSDSSAPVHEAWSAGLARTLAALPESARVVVLADTPELEQTPSLCLSGNLEQALRCARERSGALDTRWLEVERRVTEDAGARFVDVNPYLCSDVCAPVIGPYLVYRDRHHLTTAIVTALAAPLGGALDVAFAGGPQRSDTAALDAHSR